MSILLRGFRIVDAGQDFEGDVLLDKGIIAGIGGGEGRFTSADAVIEGHGLVLMPAFVDMHAHFRDAGLETGTLPAETLESGCMAASAGGYGTVVCMANTTPVMDNFEAALRIRTRAQALGLVDLFPALSLTQGMEGKALAEWAAPHSGLPSLAAPERGLQPSVAAAPHNGLPILVSEDGKDVDDDALFEEALQAAARAGILVACHCGKTGDEAARVERAIRLGRKTGARIHLMHLSCREAIDGVKRLDSVHINGNGLSAETTPLYLAANEEDAERMGRDTYGRVNPPLRPENDRQAVLAAVKDGTISVIATDHAPHTEAEKALGKPGFVGLETAFAASYTSLVQGGLVSLSRLSALMSANPAHILGLNDRGLVKAGLRADLVVVDPDAEWTVDPMLFKSRGRSTPFAGKTLRGRVLATLYQGRLTGSQVH